MKAHQKVGRICLTKTARTPSETKPKTNVASSLEWKRHGSKANTEEIRTQISNTTKNKSCAIPCGGMAGTRKAANMSKEMRGLHFDALQFDAAIRCLNAMKFQEEKKVIGKL